MLLPALNKAKDRANTVKCKNNQKQIMLNLLMYIDEYHSMAKSSKVGKINDSGVYPFSTDDWSGKGHPGVAVSTGYSSIFCGLFDQHPWAGNDKAYPIGAVLAVTGCGEWMPLHEGNPDNPTGTAPIWADPETGKAQGVWQCGNGAAFVGVVRSCEATTASASCANPYAGSQNWTTDYYGNMKAPETKVVTCCVSNDTYNYGAPEYNYTAKGTSWKYRGEDYTADGKGKSEGANCAHGLTTSVVGFADGHVGQVTNVPGAMCGKAYPQAFVPGNSGLLNDSNWASGERNHENDTAEFGRPLGWAIQN